jgi:hypothetical protein
LGYHIEPRIGNGDQTLTVQISITLAVLIAVVGFMSGIFSLITFSNKDLCKVGYFANYDFIFNVC